MLLFLRFPGDVGHGQEFLRTVTWFRPGRPGISRGGASHCRLPGRLRWYPFKFILNTSPVVLKICLTRSVQYMSAMDFGYLERIAQQLLLD